MLGATGFENNRGRYAVPVVGDFDGDGKSDIAWVGGEDATGRAVNIPIAFSNGDGSFRLVIATAPAAFLSYSTDNVQFLVGDFNGDGLADIALTGSSFLTTIPVAFSNGPAPNNTFAFSYTSNAIVGEDPNFATYASWAGVKAVVGDFDGNGSADIALTGGSGWWTIPVAFSGLGYGQGTFYATNYSLDDSSSESIPYDSTVPGVVLVSGGY